MGVGRSVCPFCPEVALDPLGHHAATCRHGGDVVVRHNHLCDVIVDFSRRAHLLVTVEKGHGLTKDHNHTSLLMCSLRGGTEESLQHLTSQ